MSLLHCAECGHEVSDNAVACPNCGRPVNVPPVAAPKVVVMEEPRTRDGFPAWAFIPIGVLGLILVILMFVLWNRNSDDTANQRININSNGSRQTTTARSSEPTTVTTVPSSSAPSSVTVPSSVPSTQSSVPGSQTTVAESPTKGKVNIVAKLAARNGSTQMVRNEKFYLLDQDIETILISAGVEPIEGQSLTSSLGLSLVFPDRYGEFNRNAFTAIRKHIKYSGQTDGSGKAMLSGVEPNSYYLFGMTKAGHGFTVWNSPVSVQVGDNILNLSPQSLTEIQDPAG